MTFTRRHLLFGLLSLYMGVRVLSAVVGVYTEPFLLKVLERRAGETLPQTVCYPLLLGQDERGYLSSLYAIAPSMLVQAGVPCEAVLSP